MTQLLTVQKIQKVFGATGHRNTILDSEEKGKIPKATRTKGGHRKWTTADLPVIGEKFGFMKKLTAPKVLSFFITKGGVFKSSLAINLGRMAALHNIKTIIVGLDTQCDSSGALGYDIGLSTDDSLEEAQEKISDVYSLPDLLDGGNLWDMIVQTDIPTLSYLPETPDLDFLEEKISHMPMRDFWLAKHVVNPLKSRYDLIILDLGPAWNMLSVNSLTACDILVSPIECKFNHFRNIKTFQHKIKKFKSDTESNFEHIYIPVKHSKSQNLSNDIFKNYILTLPNCISTGIRETQQGEDSIANGLSVIEYDPMCPTADDTRSVLTEMWPKIYNCQSNPINSMKYSKKSTLPIKKIESANLI